MASADRPPVLTLATLPENVIKCQYAVRGEIYKRAAELKAEGREITLTNVGNPHALGQRPITFNRLVLSLMYSPHLLDHPDVLKMFPRDAVARARTYLKAIPAGMGAYSDSRGHMIVREEICAFIRERDGPAARANPDHVFITDGASAAVKLVLQVAIRGPMDGILVPIPQYPLYSASIAAFGGQLVPYHLDEDKEWGLDLRDVRSAIAAARARGIQVRGMVFINPGNPTGACLSEADLRGLCTVAHEERLVLMADEVYQGNVYQTERPFISCKKVLAEMGGAPSRCVELFSFHSVSKGYTGECGMRGGYVECTNVDAEVIDQMYKLVSVSLSPGILGQVEMGLMVNPLKPGDPSYAQFDAERTGIIKSLERRAHIMTDAFNECEGFRCNFTEGAMYSFPRVTLPKRAVEAARAAGKQPDVFYCLKMLEATGISTVPGSGFGQRDGTWHFRTTILPPEDKMVEVMAAFKRFNAAFMDEYRDKGVGRAGASAPRSAAAGGAGSAASDEPTLESMPLRARL